MKTRSQWIPVLLGDALSLNYGKGLTALKRREGRVPVVGSGGIVDSHDTPLVKSPGIVIGRKGNVGAVTYVKEPFWPIDTTYYIGVDDTDLDLRFLAAALSVVGLNSLDSHAAVPGLNREIALSQVILVPPLVTQRQVASVLAAYDELIENNLRRIEILEEMAQAVYREWFVNFRFPGHESVALVDSPLGSIPEGWEIRSFSEIADFVNGYAFKPAHLGDVGLPIVKIKELKNGITLDTPRNLGVDIPAKFRIEQGDLLFSWSADLVVQLWPHGPALLNQHLFRVSPRESDIDLDFLVHALTRRLPEFRARAQGTTMRHIKRSALSEVQEWLPPVELRELFTDYVRPKHRLARNLFQQNTNLRATRDLLLPKLVSGEIDVSDLDIDTEWLAL